MSVSQIRCPGCWEFEDKAQWRSSREEWRTSDNLRFPVHLVWGTTRYLSYLKYVAWDSLNKGSKWKYLGKPKSWWQNIHSYLARSLETRNKNMKWRFIGGKREQDHELKKWGFSILHDQFCFHLFLSELGQIEAIPHNTFCLIWLLKFATLTQQWHYHYHKS